jgi:hypothetical protein
MVTTFSGVLQQINSSYVKFSKILWDRQSDRAAVELLGENKHLESAGVRAALNRTR